MRFIARTVTPGIYQNETVVAPKSIYVPDPRPARHTPQEPMLKHQRRAFTLDLVVDTDALIDCV